jgi:hypothetical protein
VTRQAAIFSIQFKELLLFLGVDVDQRRGEAAFARQALAGLTASYRHFLGEHYARCHDQ